MRDGGGAMNTPIAAFLRDYAASDPARFHMPGHKGLLSPYDITEVPGADALYEADGIIRESEENAGEIFGARTFYSTEGSSHGIRAMLWLTTIRAEQMGRKPLIAAARNVHASFLSAAVLIGFEIAWLPVPDGSNALSVKLPGQEVERFLRERKPAALYLTSPDYLGTMWEIGEIARICHENDVLLLCDNAHGAYLKFLEPPRHPMDLGADLCVDSAHKTLPVLTGGAYLHIAKTAPEFFNENAREALRLFGSTSPSYLTLGSLDAFLGRAEDFSERLLRRAEETNALKAALRRTGWVLCGDEPLKITVAPKTRGYFGDELLKLLRENGIAGEFADHDFLVLMVSPDNSAEDLRRLYSAFSKLPPRAPILEPAAPVREPEMVMTPGEAARAPKERLAAEACEGRICAELQFGCPPAVPVAICGERLGRAQIAALLYYGVTECAVVREGV